MSEGKVEQWPRVEFEQILEDALDNVQAEAYERGVRDAANKIQEHVDYLLRVVETADPNWPAYLRNVGAALKARQTEILALLQANPYRAVVETEAKKEEHGG